MDSKVRNSTDSDEKNMLTNCKEYPKFSELPKENSFGVNT